MGDADRLRLVLAPVPYSALWLVLGALSVLVALGWLVGVLVWTLPVERLRNVPVLRGFALRVLKRKFTRSVDRITARHQRGELTSRAAHSAISRTVRSFLQLWTGEPAARMVLAEFAEGPLAKAAPAIAAIYPGQFSRPAPEAEHGSRPAPEAEHGSRPAPEAEHGSAHDEPDLASAARAAKEVLAQWV